MGNSGEEIWIVEAIVAVFVILVLIAQWYGDL